jgi:hypothetical protein
MDCKTYNKISDLINEFAKHTCSDKPLIIGIDGAVGSGKTILSYCMGCKLKFPVINLDQFLNMNSGGYLSQIRYNDLEEYIKSKSKAGKTIIVEGACLLKIFDKIQIKHDFLVYVKRMSCNNGRWCEELELSGHGKIIENPQNDLEKLSNEIILYHNEFNPSINAHYCFERMEEA